MGQCPFVGRYCEVAIPLLADGASEDPASVGSGRDLLKKAFQRRSRPTRKGNEGAVLHGRFPEALVTRVTPASGQAGPTWATTLSACRCVKGAVAAAFTSAGFILH